MRQIDLNGKRYSLEWLSERANEAAQNLLKNAAKKIVPTCHCIPGQALPLYISHRGDGPYFLAKNRDTGLNHADWCDFYGETSASSGGANKPALMEKNGRTNIKIDSALKHFKAGPEGATPVQKGKTVSRGTWTLRGLLEELWDRAQFNKYFPRAQYKRSIKTIHNYVMKEAESIDIGRRNLKDLLFIPIFETKAGQHKKEIEVRTPDIEQGMIVIGKLNALVDSKFSNGGIGLQLEHLASTIWMTDILTAWVKKHFKREVDALALTNCQIMVICTVFRNESTLNAGAIGLRRVSPDFIPVDSSYELSVTEKLVQEGRFFRKPLRHRGEGVLPDFVLMDTDPIEVMEVFGMEDDPEYSARKTAKMAIYQQQGIKVWAWSPAHAKDVVPSFTPKQEA